MLFLQFLCEASAKPPKALLLKGLRPDSRAFFHRSQFEDREPAGNISTDAARRKIKIVGKGAPNHHSRQDSSVHKERSEKQKKASLSPAGGPGQRDKGAHHRNISLRGHDNAERLLGKAEAPIDEIRYQAGARDLNDCKNASPQIQLNRFSQQAGAAMKYLKLSANFLIPLLRMLA